jgi:hypothetical protein
LHLIKSFFVEAQKPSRVLRPFDYFENFYSYSSSHRFLPLPPSSSSKSRLPRSNFVRCPSSSSGSCTGIRDRRLCRQRTDLVGGRTFLPLAPRRSSHRTSIVAPRAITPTGMGAPWSALGACERFRALDRRSTIIAVERNASMRSIRVGTQHTGRVDAKKPPLTLGPSRSIAAPLATSSTPVDGPALATLVGPRQPEPHIGIPPKGNTTTPNTGAQ